MNKVEALNVLTRLADEAVSNGVIKSINDCGSIYNALIILAQEIRQEEGIKQPVVETEK